VWARLLGVDDRVLRLRARRRAGPGAFDEPAAFGVFGGRVDSLAIGGIGFFGPPGPDGAVELGYGIVEPLRGRGIATEALVAAAHLALANGAILVKADTTPDNIPSQRGRGARPAHSRWAGDPRSGGGRMRS
jgi:RimJ/RimL family protein N-acetyltransferase